MPISLQNSKARGFYVKPALKFLENHLSHVGAHDLFFQNQANNNSKLSSLSSMCSTSSDSIEDGTNVEEEKNYIIFADEEKKRMKITRENPTMMRERAKAFQLVKQKDRFPKNHPGSDMKEFNSRLQYVNSRLY